MHMHIIAGLLNDTSITSAKWLIQLYCYPVSTEKDLDNTYTFQKEKRTCLKNSMILIR